VRDGYQCRAADESEAGQVYAALEIVALIAALDIQDAIIDGEMVALDDKGRSSFQALQGFDMGQERTPIVFYAFDLGLLGTMERKVGLSLCHDGTHMGFL
jgi:bifunctional non-homologous end joining protein LigD